MEFGSSPTEPREAKPSFTRRFRPRSALALPKPLNLKIEAANASRTSRKIMHSMTPRSDPSCPLRIADDGTGISHEAVMQSARDRASQLSRMISLLTSKHDHVEDVGASVHDVDFQTEHALFRLRIHQYLQRLEKDLERAVLTRTWRFRSKSMSKEVPGRLPIINLVHILLQIEQEFESLTSLQREQAMQFYKVFTRMKNISGEEQSVLSPKAWQNLSDNERLCTLLKALEGVAESIKAKEASRDAEIEAWKHKIEDSNLLLEQAADAADAESKRARHSRQRLRELEQQNKRSKDDIASFAAALDRAKEQQKQVSNELAETQRKLELANANASNWFEVRNAYTREAKEMKRVCDHQREELKVMQEHIEQLEKKTEIFESLPVKETNSLEHESKQYEVVDVLSKQNISLEDFNEEDADTNELSKCMKMQIESARQEMKTQLRQKEEEIALLQRSATPFSSEDGEKHQLNSELMSVFQHEMKSMREAFMLKLKHKDELLKLRESEHRKQMEYLLQGKLENRFDSDTEQSASRVLRRPTSARVISSAVQTKKPRN